MPQLLVFGARNLGRVIAEHLISQGWEATGVARSEETVAAFPGRGLQADLTDRDQMRRVVEEAGCVRPCGERVLAQGPLRRRRPDDNR